LLFSGHDGCLPFWFTKRDWVLSVGTKKTSFLPPDLGLIEFEHKTFKIKVLNPAGAVMECLYLAPNSQPLVEVFELMEGLNNLRPTTVQTLLEACTSIKVKRLFLYLADKAGHEWLTYINFDKIDLGSGKRAIVSDGVYVSKYQITVPKDLDSMNR